MPSLCRDCDFETTRIDGTNCPSCGSARLVDHQDIRTLAIAHIDCDAFFAAIEKRDNPELRDKPVIVGGGRRGVVSTACYIARLHGVHSAQPMFKALKACPEAFVVKPRRDAYVDASKQIREKLVALTPLVQMVSIDEAFLDLSGTERVHGVPPAVALNRLARDIEADLGLTISIGLSENKSLAKTASELDKPRGFAALSAAEAPEFLAPRPIHFLHGVGKQLARKLERDGLSTIADLQRFSQRELILRYGETGQWLHERAFGRDNRPVRADTERKSVSAERTFDVDLADQATLEDRLWEVCDETARRSKRHGVEGATITMKLKTQQFKTLTRSTTLTTPTQLAQTLFRATQPLLAKEVGTGQAYRLIGVGLSHLSPAKGDAPDLIDPSVEKRAKAERASDLARDRFGDAAVTTGRGVRMSQKKRAHK
ncbi:MAG: DNA polymerase IV, partial [Pseudomonadota bacterium]